MVSMVAAMGLPLLFPMNRRWHQVEMPRMNMKDCNANTGVSTHEGPSS